MYKVHLISGEPKTIPKAEYHETYEGIVSFYIYKTENHNTIDCGIYIPLSQIKYMEYGELKEK